MTSDSSDKKAGKSKDSEVRHDASDAKPRRRHDSSLYRDVAAKDRKGSGAGESNAETSLKQTAEHINNLAEKLQASQDGLPRPLRREPEDRFRFVLQPKGPEIVPVDHQAVIEELAANLDSIDVTRRQLEKELTENNSANKLQIAQIKGRLADLRRKKTEIEALLRSRSDVSTPAAADEATENDE